MTNDRANYSVVARCEVHGTAVKPGMKAGEKQYMSAFALNEWDSKLAGGVEWRQKIDTQVEYMEKTVLLCIDVVPFAVHHVPGNMGLSVLEEKASLRCDNVRFDERNMDDRQDACVRVCVRWSRLLFSGGM